MRIKPVGFEGAYGKGSLKVNEALLDITLSSGITAYCSRKRLTPSLIRCSARSGPKRPRGLNCFPLIVYETKKCAVPRFSRAARDEQSTGG